MDFALDFNMLLLRGYCFTLLVNIICCGDPTCPSNIKSCYNCEVEGGCLETEYKNIAEEECLRYLTTQQIIWSVEYDHDSGDCRESTCEDVKIQYSEGKVIHRKTCDTTACADYTVTVMDNKIVSESELASFYEEGPKDWECLSRCLSTNTSCTLSYDSSTEQCAVYTGCQDSCALTNVTGHWRVFKKSCGNTGTTPSISSELTTTAPPSTTRSQTTTTLTTTTQTTASPTTTTQTTQSLTTTTQTTTSPTTTTQTTTSPTTTTQTTTSPTTTTKTTTSPTTTTQTTTTPTITAQTTTTPTTTSQTTASPITTSQTTTALITDKKLYIAPCICFTNKTFVNMTLEEIIQQLIKDTEINTKNTVLAQSKLKSKNDRRTSSAVIGTICVVILCILAGFTIFCDLTMIIHDWRTRNRARTGKPLKEQHDIQTDTFYRN